LSHWAIESLIHLKTRKLLDNGKQWLDDTMAQWHNSFIRVNLLR